MNQLDPRSRHRGYFLDPDPAEGEPGETDSAEGFVVRLRIVRPLHKQAVAAARPVRPPSPAASRYTRRRPKAAASATRDRS